jgi:hypothetical protein
MSTFYAVFQDPTKGRLAVMALLDQGVPTDDISLVAKGVAIAFGKPASMEEAGNQPMADTTVFVQSPDDPVIDQLVPEGVASETKYAARESDVGGGIETSTLDDSIDSVDQSNDSQWLAEDDIDPGVTPDQADQELHDLDMAVETGYPSKPVGLDNFPTSSVPNIEDLERSLEMIDVPGFGVVIGGGPLATAVLDYGDGDTSDDVPEMMKHFREEGVPDELAKSYLDCLDKGQAILAVGLVPGEVEPPLVEAVADQFGASNAATFDAPRY